MTFKAIAVGLTAFLALATQSRTTLPTRLTDTEFWDLSQSLSETGASLSSAFRNDNLVSNETGFQKVLPRIVRDGPAGGAYLGVGPEQNFTYIAALQPAIAFIVDIRRENRDLQLLYKALFELSSDRLDFLALQFSRPRPDNLGAQADLASIFTAYAHVAASQDLYEQNLRRLQHHLTATRSIPLSQAELQGIASVYDAFRRFGPDITYDSASSERLGIAKPSMRGRYVELMLATNADGQLNSFLSSDERFQMVKRLEEHNLIVPVVGNFAGPTALRSGGRWLRERGGIVSAFYISNVRAYLRSPALQNAFCGNLRALPGEAGTLFISAGAPPPDATADPSKSVRGSVELQGPPGQTELVYFLTSADGTRRRVSEDEYGRAVPDPVGVSSFGKLSELSEGCGGGFLDLIAPLENRHALILPSRRSETHLR